MTVSDLSTSDPFGAVQQFRLEDMHGGWFVGGFAPAALHNAEAEVAVKRYHAGESEAAHCHQVGTEVTLLLEGRAVMCSRELAPGDIVVIPPGIVTGFRAITDVTTVVVKTPSVPGDKYPSADPTIGR